MEISHLDFVNAATEIRYLNASNRELAATNEVQLSFDNPDPPSSEKKALRQLLKFTFQELKSATGNFRLDSILGEGGFGYVFKGWIEENGTAPAKPGSGVTVAVKSLKPDGLQGHREWVVSSLSALVVLMGYFPLEDNHIFQAFYSMDLSVRNNRDEEERFVDMVTKVMISAYKFPILYALESPKNYADLLQFLKGPYLFHGPAGLRLHLVQLKGWHFFMEVLNLSFIEILRHPTFCLIRYEYNAKLSDFGLAKAGPQGDKTHVSTRVVGTYGYAAPEYVMTGKKPYS
ncbi:hypothetical protein HHK36_006279 [Tetracentron sinense]|uniref:Protein kinase domain-containing protein n=1 Tax=Tetracentron sinense TaxID=13715 RepID=A0A834ZL86_TETSI|nr:hypothetical protein HHK36_006279 [Tetracentron sinense]